MESLTLEQRKEFLRNGYHLNTYTCENRVSRVFENLPVINNGLILDLGCSTGMTTRELSRFYPDSKIIGIDLRREVIKNQSFDRICYFAADGFNPPFQDSVFDAVFCMNNLIFPLFESHCKDLKPNFSRVVKLVKIGGYLLFSTDNYYEIFFKTTNGLDLYREKIPKKQERKFKGVSKSLREVLGVAV